MKQKLIIANNLVKQTVLVKNYTVRLTLMQIQFMKKENALIQLFIEVKEILLFSVKSILTEILV